MKHPNVSDRRQRIPTYVWVDEKTKKSTILCIFIIYRILQTIIKY